jgi:hypothetical protein
MNEKYINKANNYFNEDYEEENKGNIELENKVARLMHEYSIVDVLAASISVLTELEPETAKVLKSALGPLGES